MRDLQFARFLVPLALTLIAQGFSSQFLTGGMTRLPQSVPGATRGVGALLSGFVLEAAVVWWGVRGGAYLAKWRR